MVISPNFHMILHCGWAVSLGDSNRVGVSITYRHTRPANIGEGSRKERGMWTHGSDFMAINEHNVLATSSARYKHGILQPTNALPRLTCTRGQRQEKNGEHSLQPARLGL